MWFFEVDSEHYPIFGNFYHPAEVVYHVNENPIGYPRHFRLGDILITPYGRRLKMVSKNGWKVV